MIKKKEQIRARRESGKERLCRRGHADSVTRLQSKRTPGAAVPPCASASNVYQLLWVLSLRGLCLCEQSSGYSFFFPLSGNLNNSSGVLQNTTNGYNWSSSPRDASNSWNLNFNSSNANVNNNNPKNGFPVRCVQEPAPVFVSFLTVMLLEDIFTAYYDARRNKRNTKSQLQFEINLEENLVGLYEDIANKRYEVGASTCFITHVPVQREVFAAGFRDRVVHHLLYNYIASLLERNFIYDCYSCRIGKGTLFGIERLEHHLRSCSENYTRTCYILKLDIQGYFMNINRDLLYRQVMMMLEKYEDWVTPDGEKWKDTYQYDCAMYLLPLIIYNNPVENCVVRGSEKDWEGLPPSKSLFHSPEGCGLPIGNLTSQLFSNVYLTGFDHYVKRELGCRHYGRYVDDFYLIDTDKKKLLWQKECIDSYLRERCMLKLHPAKVYLQEGTKGVTYLGVTIKPYRRYAGDRVVKNFKKLLYGWDKRLAASAEPGKAEIRGMRSSVNSYLGLLRHYNSYRLKRHLFCRPNRMFRYGYLKKGMHTFYLAKRYAK